MLYVTVIRSLYDAMMELSLLINSAEQKVSYAQKFEFQLRQLGIKDGKIISAH